MSVFSSNVNSPAPEINHWHQLALLLRLAPDIAQSLLRRPPPPGIPSEKHIAAVTASSRQRGLTELLEKHLFSGFLLTPLDQRDQWPIFAPDVAKRLFPGAEQNILQALPWIYAPILAVQGKKGRIVSMMLGLLPDSTNCQAIGLPAPDALTAKAAWEACRVAAGDHGLAYWFIQQEDEQPVRGNSLALPIALALDFLRRSASWPKGLYATGGLTPDGSIVPVDHVRKKYSSVAFDCRLFLAPADTAQSCGTAAQPIHACTTFDDACFAARLYSGGSTAADILLYQACWISEHNFFNHFHELPPAMITSDRAGDFYRRVRAAPDNSMELLRRCFDRCSHDRQRGKIMADLFSPEEIQNLADRSPSHGFAAFNWCLAVVAFHNHCGQVTESRSWCSCAETLRTMVDPKEINKFINHSFVDRRFNRYDFRPEPTPEMTAVLEQEENKQKAYPGSNALLGALYGTLAQNYGFCGPTHLSSLLEMTARARKAFGRKYPRKPDRLINYEIYGCLDSGKMEQAVKLTAKYLGLREFSKPEDWLKQTEVLLTSEPFKTALVMRLLSEIAYKPPPSWITGSMSLICRQHGHPWQQIALNLGRMAVPADRLEDAELLFRHSLRICLADSDTMHPMGLLALYELHRIGQAEAEDYSKAQEISKWLQQTDRLNTDHFQTILGLADSEDLLHRVNMERCRFFPFSYR